MKLNDILIGILLPYQKNYIKDNSRVVVIEKSRRVGITYAAALWAVLDALKYKRDVNFVSANQKTSQEFIDYCKNWCEVINAISGEDLINLTDSTTETIRLPQSKIVALSSNPTALRGRGGSVILDEFAFAEQPRDLLAAAQAVGMWGGHLHIISSQNGPATLFYDICRKAEKKELPYSHHLITIDKACDDGLAEKLPGEHHKAKDKKKALIDLLREECINEDIFLQEYMCQPAEISTLISSDEYDACVVKDWKVFREFDPEEKWGTIYLGIDIGRVKDLTVIWGVQQGWDKEINKYVYRTVVIRSLQGVKFENQRRIINEYIEASSAAGVAIDASGLGSQLAEELKEEWGNILHEIKFTAQTKANLVERFKKYVSTKRMSLPDDEEIKKDILSMERIISKSGNIAYDGRSSVGHCDYFIAASLALEAAETTNYVSFAAA